MLGDLIYEGKGRITDFRYIKSNQILIALILYSPLAFGNNFYQIAYRISEVN
jgi:hypothetical protein